MMEKIGVPETHDSPFSKIDNAKKLVTRSLLNHAGLFIGTFLCLVCVLVLTTDIRFDSLFEVSTLDAELFVLMFASYSMYITTVDSGKREAMLDKIYRAAVTRYESIKTNIISRGIQAELCNFCQKYAESELERTRASILAQVGLKPSDFEKYQSSDIKTIKKDENLTKREKSALIEAIKLKPIKINAEMFLRCGRGAANRSPLGKSPEVTQTMAFIFKLLSVTITSLLTGKMILDVITAPSLAMVATVAIRLLPIILNGFFGYKFGYDLIAKTTTDYITDQADFLEEFEKNTKD